MAKRVKVAQIGGGRVSHQHAAAWGSRAGAELTAACDLDRDKALDYARGYGVPTYQSYHEMLHRHPDVDVVSILTPSGMHHEHAIDVICTYSKHIFIEKPTVLTPTQGRELVAAAASRGVRVFPIYQNRFNKAVTRVRRALRSGELGELRVVTVRVRWCRPQEYYDLGAWRGTLEMDGGALMNQGIHYVDLLRHLAGEVTAVSAVARTLGARIEVEDTIVALVEFAEGFIGVIEIMTSARPVDFEASISFVGSRGLAVVGGIAANELQVFSPDAAEQAVHSEEFHSAYGFGHDAMAEAVIDTLLTDAPTPISLEDALQTIDLVHAIYRSSETEGWIRLQEHPESAYVGKVRHGAAELYRTPPLTQCPESEVTQDTR